MLQFPEPFTPQMQQEAVLEAVQKDTNPVLPWGKLLAITILATETGIEKHSTLGAWAVLSGSWDVLYASDALKDFESRMERYRDEACHIPVLAW